MTDGELESTTTAEVIQEFVHVRAKRRGREDAVALGEDYADLLYPLLTVATEQLRRGLEIFTRCDRLGTFDAVLAAAALSTGADAFVSADAAFATVPALTHITPKDNGIAELLAQSGGLSATESR